MFHGQRFSQLLDCVVPIQTAHEIYQCRLGLVCSVVLIQFKYEKCCVNMVVIEVRNVWRTADIFLSFKGKLAMFNVQHELACKIKIKTTLSYSNMRCMKHRLL